MLFTVLRLRWCGIESQKRQPTLFCGGEIVHLSDLLVFITSAGRLQTFVFQRASEADLVFMVKSTSIYSFFFFSFFKRILLSSMRIYSLAGDPQSHPSELLDAVRLHPDDVQQLRGQGSRGPFLYKTHPRNS